MNVQLTHVLTAAHAEMWIEQLMQGDIDAIVHWDFPAISVKLTHAPHFSANTEPVIALPDVAIAWPDLRDQHATPQSTSATQTTVTMVFVLIRSTVSNVSVTMVTPEVTAKRILMNARARSVVDTGNVTTGSGHLVVNVIAVTVEIAARIAKKNR